MRLEKPGVRGHSDIEYQIITHLKYWPCENKDSN
jgi:hypothetical protein